MFPPWVPWVNLSGPLAQMPVSSGGHPPNCVGFSWGMRVPFTIIYAIRET